MSFDEKINPWSQAVRCHGFFWFSPVLKISFAPNKEIRTFFNKVGEQVAVYGKVYWAEFSPDAGGYGSGFMMGRADYPAATVLLWCNLSMMRKGAGLVKTCLTPVCCPSNKLPGSQQQAKN